ncbi:MAG: cobalt ABC transporter permease [Pseudomonadota bacterium]
MKRATVFALTALLLSFGAVTQALAHKVIASVFTSGETIEGEIGFSNGDMAVDTLVEVFDGDGNKLGEVTTDSDGFFSFKPTQKVIHVFKSNLGAGHVAEVRMEIEELPEIAAASSVAETVEGAENSQVSSVEISNSDANAEAAAGAAISLAALEQNRELLREMIHREVTPLRREIAAYKEKNDFQTILGGIGYIVGLFGLFFYLAARRKLAQVQ